MKFTTLALAAAVAVTGLSIGCADRSEMQQDRRMDTRGEMKPGDTIANPGMAPGRDASRAGINSSGGNVPDPNGAGVGATGTGTGGPTNRANTTTAGPDAR